MPTDDDAGRPEAGYRLRVAAETAYPRCTPGGRVRIANYVPHLAKHGVDLRYLPTLTDAEYATIASAASSVRKVGVVARAATRLARRPAPDGLRLVYRLRFLAPLPGLESASRIDAYDFDDAMFATTGGMLPRWLKREGQRCLAYAREARLVIAGNAYLADWARQYAERVEVIPSCVDPWSQPIKRHEQVDVPTVGWIGSGSTTPYLRQIVPVLEQMNAGGTKVKLLLVGAAERFEARWIEQRRWTLEGESDLIESFDIGIMPLPDDPWTRGKCGYKLLQYFSAGVPAVASPVGINAQLVGDDRGFLARSLEEWRAGLEQLARDHAMRAQMGERARDLVEQHFSYRRWAPELARLLKSMS